VQLNPGRRTWRSQAVVIISSVIVAATGALVITSCSTTQHPATLPQVNCGAAWTHFVNSDSQFFGADHGTLTCFNTAARECRPATIHVTEMGVDTGTDLTFTIKPGGTSCQVIEQSQYYSANGGGSHGPVLTTACHRTTVTSRGVSLTCSGQAVLIPAKVTPL